MNSLSLRIESAGRWATVALGFAIPISVVADNLLLAIVLLAWLACGSVGEKLSVYRRNPVAIAATALFVLTLIGASYGLGEAADKLGQIGKYSSLAFVPLFAFFFSKPGMRELGLKAFALAMLLTLIFSFAIWLGPASAATLFGRPSDNPTVFKLHITHGIFMAFAAFLFAVFSARAPSPRLRWALLVLAALAAFNVLFMVQGRTGYLVLAVLATLLFGVRYRWKGAAAALVTVVIVAAIGYQFSVSFHKRVDQVGAQIDAWQPRQGNQTPVGLRMDYYSNALAIIRDHPLAGVGIGGFETAYAEKIKGTQMAPSNNPHNQYLLITAQLGAIGLAALLALFGVQWWRGATLPVPWRIVAWGLVLTYIVGDALNSLLLDHAERLLFAWMTGLVFSLDGGVRSDAAPGGVRV